MEPLPQVHLIQATPDSMIACTFKRHLNQIHSLNLCVPVNASQKRDHPLISMLAFVCVNSITDF